MFTLPLVRRHARHVHAVENDLALRGTLEPGDHPKGRGLPAARRTEEREELAGSDLQVDPVDGGEVAEALHEVDQLHLATRHEAGVYRGMSRSARVRYRRPLSGAPAVIIRAWSDPTAEGALAPLTPSRTFPLLAGYWSFGQFWGVWVILVLEFQRHHSLTDSQLGLLTRSCPLAAIGTMLAGAPRLQRLSLRASVPVSLACLAVADRSPSPCSRRRWCSSRS